MSRYRKVEPRMWGDAKFRSLTPLPPSGQSLWLYLLTCPEHTAMPGVILITQGQIADRLKWPVTACRAACEAVCSTGMAQADWDAGLVWLPNAIRHNAPESPSVVVGWGKVWPEIPECLLKARIHEAFSAWASASKAAWASAWNTACPAGPAQGVPHQEQEQEQEKDPPTPLRGNLLKKKSLKVPRPDPFPITEEMRQWFHAKIGTGIPSSVVQEQHDVFLRWTSAGGYTKVDWVKTWQNSMVKAKHTYNEPLGAYLKKYPQAALQAGAPDGPVGRDIRGPFSDEHGG